MLMERTEPLSAGCCVAGGPAGMMLGLLLAHPRTSARRLDGREVAELTLVLRIALDVGPAWRQQGTRRSGKRQRGERVDHRESRQGDGNEHGRHRPRAGDPDQRAERTTNQPSDRHLLVAGDEPLQPLPSGVVGPLLGR